MSDRLNWAGQLSSSYDFSNKENRFVENSGPKLKTALFAWKTLVT